MCLHNIRYLSVAPVPQCSHPRWYLGGSSTSTDGTLVGMSEKYIGWNQLIWALRQDLSLIRLVTPNGWDRKPVLHPQDPCWHPQQRGKLGTKWRGNIIRAGINSLGGREDVDRGLGLEKGVWEEAARTKPQISSGVRGKGAEMRWRTCAYGMETPYSPDPMSQLDVGGKIHTCKAAF